MIALFSQALFSGRGSFPNSDFKRGRPAKWGEDEGMVSGEREVASKMRLSVHVRSSLSRGLQKGLAGGGWEEEIGPKDTQNRSKT